MLGESQKKVLCFEEVKKLLYIDVFRSRLENDLLETRKEQLSWNKTQEISTREELKVDMRRNLDQKTQKQDQGQMAQKEFNELTSCWLA